MNFNSVFIDLNKSGINKFLLTGVKAWYKYKDGKRTDERLGTTYEVALPNRMLEKISIHVKGDAGTLTPKLQSVSFKNLQVSTYPNYRNPNELGVSASADAIEAIKHE